VLREEKSVHEAENAGVACQGEWGDWPVSKACRPDRYGNETVCARVDPVSGGMDKDPKKL